MHTVLIADKDLAFCDDLKSTIREESDLSVVANAYDGEEAIALIVQLWPDVIIMDPALEKLDGYYIVRKLRTHHQDYHPVIYFVSNYISDTITKMLEQLSVDVVTLKPVSCEVILQNILQIIHSGDAAPRQSINLVSSERLSKLVYDTVTELGVPNNLLSSRRTQEALIMCLQDESRLDHLQKNLYKQLGAKYNMTGSSIERNIRASMSKMVERNAPLFQAVFQGNRNLTNSMFLATVVNYIKSLL